MPYPFRPLNYFQWRSRFARTQSPYNWRNYQGYRTGFQPQPTATPMPQTRTPTAMPRTATPMPQARTATPMGMGGNMGSPISITYKFSDPNRMPTSGGQASTGGQAPNWRGALQSANTRPQYQGGLTNWLTGRGRPSRAGWGGNYGF